MTKIILCVLPFVLISTGCGGRASTVPTSMSGVKEHTVEVKTGSDGLTSEQRNIAGRIQQDNKPGAVKHLYVFSAMSGQCLLYSTVREKVTSSGKRLSPTTVYAGRSGESWHSGIPVDIGGQRHYTGEVLQDDGTYGDSIRYLYWFDSKGVYHQHYLTGGEMLHISTEPMPVKSVIVNLEVK